MPLGEYSLICNGLGKQGISRAQTSADLRVPQHFLGCFCLTKLATLIAEALPHVRGATLSRPVSAIRHAIIDIFLRMVDYGRVTSDATMTPEERSFIGQMMRRMRRAGSEAHRTPHQLEHIRRVRSIAHAARRGDAAEADRLRWLYFPESMRQKQLAAQMGNKPNL